MRQSRGRSPLVTLGELGRTVATDGTSDEVAVAVVVIDTAEDRNHALAALAGLPS